MESHAELLERWKANVVRLVGAFDEWLEVDLAWMDNGRDFGICGPVLRGGMCRPLGERGSWVGNLAHTYVWSGAGWLRPVGHGASSSGHGRELLSIMWRGNMATALEVA